MASKETEKVPNYVEFLNNKTLNNKAKMEDSNHQKLPALNLNAKALVLRRSQTTFLQPSNRLSNALSSSSIYSNIGKNDLHEKIIGIFYY